MKRKIGLSSCGKAFDKALFLTYASAGIDVMELSLDANGYASIDYEIVSEWSAQTGVEVRSFHLPFYPFETNDVSSLDEDVRQNTIDMHKRYIKAAAAVGIKIFVLHPSAEPIKSEERTLRLENARASINTLAQFADEIGALIAVENLPRTCLGNCSTEINYLTDNSKAKVCFDTNHLLTESHESFINNVGSKIIATHISDYDGIDERHWLPGEGIIDWVKLITMLDDIGYSGALLYELGYKAPKTITRSRDLENSDFTSNFNALQNKEPLLII